MWEAGARGCIVSFNKEIRLVTPFLLKPESIGGGSSTVQPMSFLDLFMRRADNGEKLLARFLVERKALACRNGVVVSDPLLNDFEELWSVKSSKTWKTEQTEREGQRRRRKARRGIPDERTRKLITREMRGVGKALCTPSRGHGSPPTA